MHKLPSFRPAWAAGQRCIVPAEAVFEPSYETGAAVRWRISQHGDVPFGIAGLYRRWVDPAGGPSLFTFTMLTVNANDHLFYRRFHRPGEEKRMPVFLDRHDYAPWLLAGVDEAPAYFKQHPGPFIGEPAALARVPKLAKEPESKDELLPPKPVQAPPPPSPPPTQGDLF